MNFRLFYRNPISGKYNFLYTHCVYCGQRVSLNRKNIGQNRFGHKFYYCKSCQGHKNKKELDATETEVRLRVQIFQSDNIMCKLCNKELPLDGELYVSGIGELIKKKQKLHLYIGDIHITHLECICEDIDDDKE